MQSQKLSISIPQQQFEFIEHYQAEHHYKTRSEVISKALQLLQQAQLEACYREASKEAGEVTDEFDSAISDGIDEDETW